MAGNYEQKLIINSLTPTVPVPYVTNLINSWPPATAPEIRGVLHLFGGKFRFWLKSDRTDKHFV
jgi:hypothetical protein